MSPLLSLAVSLFSCTDCARSSAPLPCTHSTLKWASSVWSSSRAISQVHSTQLWFFLSFSRLNLSLNLPFLHFNRNSYFFLMRSTCGLIPEFNATLSSLMLTFQSFLFDCLCACLVVNYEGDILFIVIFIVIVYHHFNRQFLKHINFIRQQHEHCSKWEPCKVEAWRV